MAPESAKIYIGEFSPVQRIRPVSRALAQKWARPSGWLNRSSDQIQKIVRPMKIKSQSSIEFAIQLSGGWAYVDSEGRVAGSIEGVLDILKFRNLMIATGGPASSIETDTITIENMSQSRIWIRDRFRFSDFSVVPKSKRSIKAWYGTYMLYDKEGEFLEITRIRGLRDKLTPKRYAVRSNCIAPVYGSQNGKIIFVKPGHLKITAR